MTENPVPEGRVKLISSDGFEFIIDDEAARVSSTIRGMLDSQGGWRCFDLMIYFSTFCVMIGIPGCDLVLFVFVYSCRRIC